QIGLNRKQTLRDKAILYYYNNCFSQQIIKNVRLTVSDFKVTDSLVKSNFIMYEVLVHKKGLNVDDSPSPLLIDLKDSSIYTLPGYNFIDFFSMLNSYEEYQYYNLTCNPAKYNTVLDGINSYLINKDNSKKSEKELISDYRNILFFQLKGGIENGYSKLFNNYTEFIEDVNKSTKKEFEKNEKLNKAISYFKLMSETNDVVLGKYQEYYFMVNVLTVLGGKKKFYMTTLCLKYLEKVPVYPSK
ncbi:MAG TPA: hypothetical protein VNX01_01610, partial [Bacteroidia bacterium]|nr:hypothetical protein [Bacteroidia bacterium]